MACEGDFSERDFRLAVVWRILCLESEEQVDNDQNMKKKTKNAIASRVYLERFLGQQGALLGRGGSLERE